MQTTRLHRDCISNPRQKQRHHAYPMTRKSRRPLNTRIAYGKSNRSDRWPHNWHWVGCSPSSWVLVNRSKPATVVYRTSSLTVRRDIRMAHTIVPASIVVPWAVWDPWRQINCSMWGYSPHDDGRTADGGRRRMAGRKAEHRHTNRNNPFGQGVHIRYVS